MKISIFILILVLLVSSSAFTQPNTLWTRTFGGGETDYGYSVQQTTDGGYIIASSTYSYGAGNFDVWLIKTDADGNQQWQQTFGGSDDDWGYSVQQTTDGGYIIAGETFSYGAGGDDVWLIKTNSNGIQQWSRTFGGTDYDWSSCVQQTESDGGYIIAGVTYSYGAGSCDVYLIKTDADGIQQWDQTFGGYSWDGGKSVQQTSDGGYIIGGWTYSFGVGSGDFYLIKTDDNGNQQWSQTFGGSEEDEGYSVQQTTDGGYIIVGYSVSYGAGIVNVFLVKTDANGNQQWQQTYGGSEESGGISVQQTEDGGYIITGGTSSYGAGDYDVYLIRTDASGNQQWQQTFGGSDEDGGACVKQTMDGGYIIVGSTESFGAGDFDIYLIRLDSEGSLVEDFGENQPVSFTLHPCFPNPFNASAVIRFELRDAGLVKLAVYDMAGKEVTRLVEGEMNPGTHEIIFDGSYLSSGIYFAKLTAWDFTQTRKMVLMK